MLADDLRDWIAKLDNVYQKLEYSEIDGISDELESLDNIIYKLSQISESLNSYIDDIISEADFNCQNDLDECEENCIERMEADCQERLEED